ncbi:hypothetical protein E0494_06175 [Marinilabiliaceae bacterium JC040]|nr:hypothetical protein [Marinilabiliaceae bacterium JC040]
MTQDLKYDIRLSRLVAVLLSVLAINGTFKTIFHMQSGSSSFTILLSSIFFLYFFYNIPIIIKRSFNMLFFGYTLLLLINVYPYLIYDNCSLVFSNFTQWNLLFWFPIGLTVYSIRNIKILSDVLYRWSFFISFVLLLSGPFHFEVGERQFYSMFFSYSLCLMVNIHLNRLFNKFSFFLLLYVIIEFCFILLYGSRTAILGIFFFFLFKLITFKKIRKLVIILAIIISPILINFKYFVTSIYIFLMNNGIYSRTLELLMNNRANKLTERDMIWRQALLYINQKPIFGWGVGGDYMTIGVSTHNGILQLMMYFGVIFGLFFLLFILFSLIKIFFIKDVYYKELLMILFSSYILSSLTIGDGFLDKPAIAIYLFLFLKIVRYSKVKNNNKISII